MKTSAQTSMFEPLESRRLMAANIAVTGGVMRVDGTDLADRIEVEAVSRTISVASSNNIPGANAGPVMHTAEYRVRVTDGKGVVRNGPDGSPLDRYYLRQGVSRIDVYAGGGSDTVNTSTTAISNKVYAGAGTLDVVNTGSGNDSVYGQDGKDVATLGAGEDYFSGAAGTDSASGGEGNDSLHGGDENDTLNGDAGHDYISGGNFDDDISAGAGNDTVKAGAGSDTVHGNSGNDVIHGENGADDLYGDSGRDSIFGGSGYDYISGGDNNDVLVAVGGSQHDTVRGNDGTDTFWVDSESTEEITSGSAETVHRIGGFKELRIDRESGSDTVQQVSRELDGQDLLDPIAVGSYENFADRPLFASTGISRTDANQKSSDAHDCYFIATLMGIAKLNPDFLTKNIVDLGDGTYAVRFQGFFGAEYVRVDADLPTTEGKSSVLTYARFGAEGSIWAPIIEKAYAFYRRNQGNYLSLDYGPPSEVFGHLGISSSTFNPFFFNAQSLANRIRDELAAGKVVVASSTDNCRDVIGNMRENHLFMVDRVETDSNGNVTKIILLDPRVRTIELTPEQALQTTDGYTAGVV